MNSISVSCGASAVARYGTDVRACTTIIHSASSRTTTRFFSKLSPRKRSHISPPRAQYDQGGRDFGSGLKELRKQGLRAAEGNGRGDGSGNGLSYGLLSAIHLASAGFFAAFPHTASELLFGEAGRPHDYLHEPLFRILAIGFATAAVVLLVQKGAAENDALDEDTHRRLNASLSFFAATQLGLQAASFATNPIVNLPAAAGLGLVAAATWWVAGRNYAKYSPEGANPGSILQSYGKDISTIGQNDGLVSIMYSFFTLSFIGAGFAYLFLPAPTLNGVFGLLAGKGPEDVFLWQLIGGSLATLVGPIAFTEREAANNNIFSDPRNRVLNLGLAVASWSHVAVLLPLVGTEQAGPLALPLTVFWGAAGLASSLIAAFPK